MNAPLQAYLEMAQRYYMEDRLDKAMQVVNDAFQEVGWPSGGWDAFYNELVCENDARIASDPRQVDGLTIELDRTAPARMFSIVSSAALEARAKVKDLMRADFSRPVIITIFQPDAATPFIIGSYGYVMHKHELDKICLPREAVLSYRESLDALTHEFTHIATFELGGHDVPSWMNEGIAQCVSGHRHEDVAPIIARYPRLISIARVQGALASADMRKDDPGQVHAAYSVAGSIVGYWLDRYGLHTLRAALQRIGNGEDDDHAIRRTLGISRGELEREWRKGIGQ
jgi:hypothetical protein